MAGEIWLKNNWAQPFLRPKPGVPSSLWRRVAGAFGRGALPIKDLTAAFDGGRTATPTKPILVYGPNEQVVTIVCGMGVTETAEIEEMVLEAFEHQQKDKSYKIAELREKAGLVPHEEVEARCRQAMEDRLLDERRNPSRYHDPPRPDKSWIRKLPEIRLTDQDREVMQAWMER